MDPTEHPQWEAQVLAEADMARAGVARWRNAWVAAKQAGRAADTQAGAVLMDHALTPLIAAFAEAQKAGGPGRYAARTPSYLARFQADVLAALTITTLLNGLMRPGAYTLMAAAREVADALATEERFAKLEEAQPDLWRWLNERQEERGATQVHRLRVLKAAAGRVELDWQPWPAEDARHVGLRCIDLAAESLPWFTVEKLNRGKRSQVILSPTLDLLTWLDGYARRAEVLRPVLGPCLMPPKPWTTPTSGGYWTQALPQVPMVKTRSPSQRRRLAEAHMPAFYDALNAIQATGWRVNQAVLDAARFLWGEGLAVAGLPEREPLPLPPKPFDIETNEEARKAWRKAAAQIHEANHETLSSRLKVEGVLAQAQRFADVPFWFVWQADFRGRLYCTSTHLNPQGDDLQRGLLLFAQGDPIEDERAAGWLMIHAANSYGVDKVSYEERIAWVEQHRAQIMEAADCPEASDWWTQADSPFTFLAACIELRNLWCDGYGYVCALPVGLDGSCNGLQHYSALLRDPVGGEATNLTPSPRPQDIYGRVAARAMERLKAEPSDGLDAPPDRDVAALLDYGWVDRKMAKRPVMVLPYGGTFHACMRYVDLALAEREAAAPRPAGWADRTALVVKLAHAIWDSIGDVVVAARQGMAYIQGVARAAAKAGRPLAWTTAAGFPAEQSYFKARESRIETHVAGEKRRLRYRMEDAANLDPARMALAGPPNFVHSQDATALHITVATAVENGVTQFAMIHDSYGTTPARLDLLAAVLRHAFVDLYQAADWLTRLAQETGVDVGPPPPPGDLDLAQVLDSPYFFA